MQHAAHDVANDGDCFYRSIHLCVKQDPDVFATLFDSKSIAVQAVRRLRQFIAENLRNNDKLQDWLVHLSEILLTCPKLSFDYPFIRKAGGVNHLRSCPDKDTLIETCAAAIEIPQVWASEFEQKVVEEQLNKFGICMITLEAVSKESLMESNDIEEQLMTALAAQDLPRCIVLIHVSNNHYMYISLKQKGLIAAKIIPVNLLIAYLQDFLE